MSHPRSVLIRAALFLVVAACTEPTGLRSTPEAVVMVNDLNNPMWPADHIILDSAHVTAEGRIQLFTTFGGGCEDHAVALLVDRGFMESSPPVLRARIAHNANNDPCDALLSQTFEFALQPVRNHYSASYGSSSGTTVLDIDGRRVTYSF